MVVSRSQRGRSNDRGGSQVSRCFRDARHQTSKIRVIGLMPWGERKCRHEDGGFTFEPGKASTLERRYNVWRRHQCLAPDRRDPG